MAKGFFMNMLCRFIVAGCVLSIPFSISAQMSVKFRGSDGWGLSSRYEQNFNNYALQTIYGKIIEIDTVTPYPDMSYGIQLKVKAGNEEFKVHLGPAWFVLHQDVGFARGNDVEVKGSKVAFNGVPTILAVELKHKDKVLLLRDSDGVPYWCAWRKR